MFEGVLESALVGLAGEDQQESGQQQETPPAYAPRVGVDDGGPDAVLVDELGQGLLDAEAEDAGHLPEPAVVGRGRPPRCRTG